MSKLNQVLQLHHSGISNLSIASQLGLYKETVNKYVHQFKDLSIDFQEVLQKDSPELEYLFNGGSPAYIESRRRLPLADNFEVYGYISGSVLALCIMDSQTV